MEAGLIHTKVTPERTVLMEMSHDDVAHISHLILFNTASKNAATSIKGLIYYRQATVCSTIKTVLDVFDDTNICALADLGNMFPVRC